jgi:hypothetical protein
MKAILLSTLLLASTGAFADYAADDLRNRTGFQGERTRAEVKAEFQQARQVGAIEHGEIGSMKAQTARTHSVGDLY